MQEIRKCASRQMTNDKCQMLNVKWSFLLILALVSTTYAANWGKQVSGTLGWLHSVFFLDQKTGWAVGSKGSFLAAEGDLALRTLASLNP